MKKRNSVPFFTKVPFAYYKNVTVGQSPNQASLIKTRSKQLYSIPSIPSTPNSPVIPAIPKIPNIPVKKNRAPKNDFGDTRQRIERNPSRSLLLQRRKRLMKASARKDKYWTVK